MNNFKSFSALHHNSSPLFLGNIWDVSSAKMFEANGFKAIGTSSKALANTFGYQDGENLPFDMILQLSKRVVEVVTIPFSVDLEAGYSTNVSGIIENILKLRDAGVVGINLEDSISGKPQLQSVADFQRTLSTIAETISSKNIEMFLNIRTDAFLLGVPNAIQETLLRIKAYENSGANGIFVPCITDKNDISVVINATKLPINVMCMPALPDFNTLTSLGVKRISMGPFVNSYLNKKASDVISSIVTENGFSVLFK